MENMHIARLEDQSAVIIMHSLFQPAQLGSAVGSIQVQACR